LLSSTLAIGFAAVANPASAQARRARLSSDLSAALAAGDQNLDVIVHGTRAEVDALAGRYALRVKRYLRSGGVLRINAGQLAALREDTAVDHLSSDAPVRSSTDVTRETIGANQVWAGTETLRALSGAGVGVAVIDSGVDPGHAALSGRVVASVDFTGGDGIDRYGHGTHVAALIAGAQGGTAETADYRGIASGAHIVNLRVLDAAGAGRASSVIEAIDWAVEHRREFNIQVINLSLGAPVQQSYRDDPLCEAAERAIRAGIVVVAAAGNFGVAADGRRIFGGITAPGNDPAVITVGALDTKGTAERSDDAVANFSSRGPTLYDHILKPDLVAPGRNVVSAEAAGSLLAAQHPERHVAGSGAEGYIQLSGSSMSAAVVSGAVALLIDARTNLRPREVRLVLQASSISVVGDGLIASGAGGLSALGAAELADSHALGRVASLQSLSSRQGGGPSLSADAAFLRGISAQKESDTIIWGQGATIIWGQSATIIWGQATTIIWGQAATIIWGQFTEDTIIWGQAATIIWGQNSDDTIIWGQNSPDTIIWGQSTPDTIIWGQATENDTIIWGQAAEDTIIWGQSAGDTIIWGQSADTISGGQS
jgi:serine protease AprX